MFRVGQKVAYYPQGSPMPPRPGSPVPKDGEVTTVSKVSESMCGRIIYVLTGYEYDMGMEQGFIAEVLRPVVDDGFAEEVLAKVTEEIEEVEYEEVLS